MSSKENKKEEPKETPKKQSFTLKAKCKIGEKEYQKGDNLEVNSKKGIEFLRFKKLID